MFLKSIEIILLSVKGGVLGLVIGAKLCSMTQIYLGNYLQLILYLCCPTLLFTYGGMLRLEYSYKESKQMLDDFKKFFVKNSS